VGSLAFGVQSMAVEETMGVNKSENSIVVGEGQKMRRDNKFVIKIIINYRK
jgi:hypothetical protein